jgi:copper chaperone
VQTTTVIAEGIVCEGCAGSVKKALLGVPGVSGVEVAVADRRVTVRHDERVSRATVTDTLKKAGFQPT